MPVSWALVELNLCRPVPGTRQVFYDIATYHTRLDSLTGNDKNGRRTMHEYYARGGTLDVPADPDGEREAHTREPTPLLTNW